MAENVESVDKKKSPTLIGIGINNLPIKFVKYFSLRAKSEYGDQYNLLFIDLWRKAEAYDAMIGTSSLEVEMEDLEEKDESKEVKVFGGGK